jgi:Domain of unknown function (DUF397)
MNSGCIEVSDDGDDVLVRDSGQPDIVVRVDRAGWTAFIAGVKAGEFDGD